MRKNSPLLHSGLFAGAAWLKRQPKPQKCFAPAVLQLTPTRSTASKHRDSSIHVKGLKRYGCGRGHSKDRGVAHCPGQTNTARHPRGAVRLRSDCAARHEYRHRAIAIGRNCDSAKPQRRCGVSEIVRANSCARATGCLSAADGHCR
jgi:hypothetical protein